MTVSALHQKGGPILKKRCFKKKNGKFVNFAMAEWAATEFVNCIDAILKGDMKFGQALKKFKVDLKARTPKYQRFCRYVKKLQKAKKQEESKILLCCMLCCN